jgi:hypothetical protein
MLAEGTRTSAMERLPVNSMLPSARLLHRNDNDVRMNFGNNVSPNGDWV